MKPWKREVDHSSSSEDEEDAPEMQDNYRDDFASETEVFAG